MELLTIEIQILVIINITKGINWKIKQKHLNQEKNNRFKMSLLKIIKYPKYFTL